MATMSHVVDEVMRGYYGSCVGCCVAMRRGDEVMRSHYMPMWTPLCDASW